MAQKPLLMSLLPPSDPFEVRGGGGAALQFRSFYRAEDRAFLIPSEIRLPTKINAQKWMETNRSDESAIRETASITIGAKETKGALREFLRLSAFTSLRSLVIVNQQLTAFPDEVFPSTLRSIDLRDNQFVHIPAAFFNLFHLTELNMEGNDLRSVVAAQMLPSSLEHLYLSRNKKLHEVNLTTLTNLKTFHCTEVEVKIKITNVASLEPRQILVDDLENRPQLIFLDDDEAGEGEESHGAAPPIFFWDTGVRGLTLTEVCAKSKREMEQWFEEYLLYTQMLSLEMDVESLEHKLMSTCGFPSHDENITIRRRALLFYCQFLRALYEKEIYLQWDRLIQYRKDKDNQIHDMPLWKYLFCEKDGGMMPRLKNIFPTTSANDTWTFDPVLSEESLDEELFGPHFCAPPRPRFFDQPLKLLLEKNENSATLHSDLLQTPASFREDKINDILTFERRELFPLWSNTLFAPSTSHKSISSLLHHGFNPIDLLIAE